MDCVSYYPQGDCAITISFGNEIDKEIHRKVTIFTDYVKTEAVPWLVEVVPSFASVTVYYDPNKLKLITPNKTPYDQVESELKSQLFNLPLTNNERSKTVIIPVCYGEEYGPDLKEIADYHQLTEQDVISIHSGQKYVVYMIGFVPGFPYLGGMSNQIATPRKATPSLKLPAGSVGIGGEQTGIYPIDSPGGWHIIGRTPLQLFDKEATHPSLLKAGDLVQFKTITPEQFLRWEV